MTERDKRDEQKMSFAYSLENEAKRLLQTRTIGVVYPAIVNEAVKEFTSSSGSGFFDVSSFADRKGIVFLASLIVQEHPVLSGYDDVVLRQVAWQAAEVAIAVDIRSYEIRAELGLIYSISRKEREDYLDPKEKALKEFQGRILEREVKSILMPGPIVGESTAF